MLVRSRVRLTAALAVACAGIGGGFVTASAGAACGGPANVVGSCFEGGDGNTAANGAENTDWATIPMAQKRRFGDGSSRFFQSAEQDPTTWQLLAEEPAPDKNDILAATTYIERIGNSSFLHVGFQMASPNGSANVLVEVNQKRLGQSDSPGGPLHAFTPDRTQNDLLIQYSGNQQAAQIARVGLCRWVGSREGQGANDTYGWYQADANDLVPQVVPPADATPTTRQIKANNKDCTAVPAARATGRVHPGPGALANAAAGAPFGAPLPVPPFSTSLEQGTFNELSLDVTNLIGSGAADPCRAFGSIWLHTYNGNSIESIMLDYVAPQPIEDAQECEISVDKTVAVGTSETIPPAGGYIDGTATTSLANEGDWLWYRLAVTNTKNVGLDAVQIDDAGCQLVNGLGVPSTDPIEKGNGDAVLDPGETWTYLCRHQLGSVALDGEAYTNTVNATATKGTFTTPVVTDNVRTGRLQPSLALVKTPDDASVNAGAVISFTMVTSNGGPGTAMATTLSDPLPAGVDWGISAESTPGACAIAGDVGSEVLTCTYGNLTSGGSRSVTVSATTSAAACGVYDNTATAKATNSPDRPDSGKITCILPTPVPVAPQSKPPVVAPVTQPGQVKGQTIRTPGSARLRGPSGCLPRSSTQVYVTGKQIRSVRFVLDGKTLRTVRTKDTAGRYAVTITRSKVTPGVHRIRAVITFTAVSKTKARTLQLRFSRCGDVKPSRARGFTG